MIEAIGLTKKYGDKVALNQVSFTVRDGEVLGLLGLNGAGKTTTMNILTGYIGATEGKVVVDGHDMLEEPLQAKRLIGYLPEQPPLYLDMKVAEYLDFVCNLRKVKTGREAHIMAIADEVGITHVLQRVIKNLSKGYRQRVGLAQALIGDPKVLILDEPTVGLDPSQIIEIRNLVKTLGKTKTIILSSHILPEIQAICERVVVLHQGTLIADDTPDNLSKAVYDPHRMIAGILGEEEAIRKALVGVPNLTVDHMGQREPGVHEFLIEGIPGTDIRADVFRALAKADLPLLSSRGNDFTMEDIFLSLIDQKSANANGGTK